MPGIVGPVGHPIVTKPTAHAIPRVTQDTAKRGPYRFLGIRGIMHTVPAISSVPGIPWFADASEATWPEVSS